MKLFLAIVMAFFSVMPVEKHDAAAAENATDAISSYTNESDLPRKTKVCWVIFGSEVICMTVEESAFQADIDVSAEFESTGSYMRLLFPEKTNGSLTVSSTVNMNVCGMSKTIQKGTKINVRNGIAKVAL